MSNWIENYRKSMKSNDTEEWFDLIFYRPLGYLWALFFRRVGVSPNGVTVFSIFLGVAAAICFYPKELSWNLWGIFFLIWANSYDSADGQLARMTGNFSPFGRLLDGFAGDIWFFSIYVALVLRMESEWGIWIWILGAVAGFCHTRQAAMAEYFRHLHICMRKESPFFFETYENQRDHWRSLRIRNLYDFFYKGHVYFYLPYLKNQERMSFRTVLALIAPFGPDRPMPRRLRDDYAEASKPYLWTTGMLSFNARSWALILGLLLDMPWIFFVFNLTVLNLVWAYMTWRYVALARRFTKRVEEGEYD